MSTLAHNYELLLRRLYDTERKLPERNYAHDHSFAEWRVDPFGERGYHIIEGVREPWKGTEGIKLGL